MSGRGPGPGKDPLSVQNDGITLKVAWIGPSEGGKTCLQGAIMHGISAFKQFCQPTIGGTHAIFVLGQANHAVTPLRF
jgi:hypothetical protein